MLKLLVFSPSFGIFVKIHCLMEQEIQAKIDSWLNGKYDENTKSTILVLQKSNPDELIVKIISKIIESRSY
jgi:hypothetical protein